MSQYIRGLNPWPVGVPLPEKGLFFFYDPDTDEEYRVYPEQVQVAPDQAGNGAVLTGQALLDQFQEGVGIKLDLLLTGKILITCTVQPTAAVLGPDAPSDGQVDDTANTLSGLLVPGFGAAADYEVVGVPGFPGIVNAVVAGGDVQNGRIYSRGLTGPIDLEKAGIRVAASGNRPAGQWLLNDKLFTGPVPVTSNGYVASGYVSSNYVSI
jgi:hypothetical protein